MKRKTNKKAALVVAEPNNFDIMTATNRDVMTALLVVSLTINLFILIGWITLQVTSVYDSQVASFLFTR